MSYTDGSAFAGYPVWAVSKQTSSLLVGESRGLLQVTGTKLQQASFKALMTFKASLTESVA